MGAFKTYTIGFVLIVFSVAMITTFSGSLFQQYDSNVSSETLNKIKDNAEDAQPSIAQQRNRTSGITPEESSFLSPQAFGVIGETLSSAGNLIGVVGAFESEIGLPGAIVGFIIGVVSLRLIWEAVSALFGWDV